MSQTAAMLVEPSSDQERSYVLDALRGFSILGILLININAFAMHISAYENPFLFGGASGRDAWTWLTVFVLVDGKLRSLFTMLFGASVVMMGNRLATKGADASDIYYKRILWLMAFGIADAYLFWMGDILFAYAICGLALYSFRKLKAKHLLAISMLIFLVDTGLTTRRCVNFLKIYRSAQVAETKYYNGEALTKEQQAALTYVQNVEASLLPNEDLIAADTRCWQSDFWSILRRRAYMVKVNHTFTYYLAFDLWMTLFLGMALMKWRVLTGEQSRKCYALLAILGYCLGLPLAGYLGWTKLNSHFSLVASSYSAIFFNIQRILVALGHLGLIMLLFKQGWLHRWFMALAKIGRMAFSNYILQSIICSTLFYGYGFGLYAKLHRFHLLLVAFAICVVQWLFSTVWLKHFRFGPLEWLWRGFSYGKLPTLRRQFD